MIKIKRAICILLAFLTVLLFLGCAANTSKVNIVEYMEQSLLPITNLSSENCSDIIHLLEESYVENEEICGFTGIALNGNANYTLVEIYYAIRLMQKTKPSAINRKIVNTVGPILKKISYDAKNRDITVIDTIALFCLNNIIFKSADMTTINNFLSQITDSENSLLYENSINDEWDDKISFTAEVIVMLETSSIDIDLSIYKEGVQKYYEATKFLMPSQGDTLFNSGGLALYAMGCVGNNFDVQKHIAWYNEWKHVYDNKKIQSSEDLLDFVCAFHSIDKLFSENKHSCQQPIHFISNIDIENYISETSSVQLIYNCLFDYMMYLPKSTYHVLADYCKERINYCSGKLMTFSFENAFYGTELAYNTGFNYDVDKLLKTYKKLYLELIGDYEEGEKENIEQLIRDSYYYAMLQLSLYNATENEKYAVEDGLLPQAVDLITKSVCKGEINNPKSIRQFCEIISNNNLQPSTKLINYLKNFVEDFSHNQYITNSYYFGDLFVIDKIIGLDIIDPSDVLDTIKRLDDNAMYKDEIDGIRSFYATFEILCLRSRFEGLEISNNETKAIYQSITKEMSGKKQTYHLDDVFYYVSILEITENQKEIKR